MKTADNIFVDSVLPSLNRPLDPGAAGLDPTGNQTAVDYFASFGSNAFPWLNWYQNTANTANEYTSRKSLGGSKALSDTFTANTTANYSSPGSSVTFTVSTSAQTLTVNTIGQDTIDGVLEPTAQAIVLTGEAIGPCTPTVTVTIPSGTTSGQMGLVFGYESGADYWLWARDMNGTANLDPSAASRPFRLAASLAGAANDVPRLTDLPTRHVVLRASGRVNEDSSRDAACKRAG